MYCPLEYKVAARDTFGCSGQGIESTPVPVHGPNIRSKKGGGDEPCVHVVNSEKEDVVTRGRVFVDAERALTLPISSALSEVRNP